MDNGVAAGGAALLFIGLISIAFIGLWLWSLIHCIINKRLSDTNRIIGVVLIIVLGLLGSLIYLFLPRESARRGYGSAGRRGARRHA